MSVSMLTPKAFSMRNAISPERSALPIAYPCSVAGATISLCKSLLKPTVDFDAPCMAYEWRLRLSLGFKRFWSAWIKTGHLRNHGEGLTGPQSSTEASATAPACSPDWRLPQLNSCDQPIGGNAVQKCWMAMFASA